MKTYLLFILFAGIIAAAYIGQKTEKRHITQYAEYHFDILDDSTILISDDGDDWETIHMDSLEEYLIDNNQ